MDRQLKKEFCYIYNRAYKKLPEDSLISAYINAHKKIINNFRDEDQKMINMIVEKNLNIFGIEFLIRRKSKSRSLLTTKLIIFSYLTECESSSSFHFRKLNAPSFLTTLAAFSDELFNLVTACYQVKQYKIV